LVIEPRRGWRALELDQLWQYRHLLGAFLRRDIKAGQKQTVLGALWLFAAPLFTMAVYTVVFGKLAKLPSDGVPYPLFVFAGLVLWNAFASAIQGTTQSVVANSHFIQKVYFPRLLIPTSAALAVIINLGIVLLCLAALLGWYGYGTRPTALLAVPISLLVLATALGIGMLLAPLNVMYRDVGMLTQFAVQIGFYLTPVVYSISSVPERYRPLLALNPLAGYIGALRWSLYGGELPVGLLVTSVSATVILLTSGAFFFARMQGRFADVI
jgi:lipopolysaccharide transport system permease protein